MSETEHTYTSCDDKNLNNFGYNNCRRCTDLVIKEWHNQKVQIAQLQAEVEALRKDSARLDWIIDNASSAGGGNGFTLKVFIPVDCECVRTAIDKLLKEPK